ncbi:palindromic element RPE4 domain-containing protein [Rickettsia asembonensis]|nr:palindromic element RPE4 domain-containing protein [Rickettsia asembonensis]
MSSRGLTTVSKKKFKKDWIPRSSRGMTVNML